MSKQEAFVIVFDELVKISTFRGVYDAKNGNRDYMNGVLAVMECIAYNINPDMYSAFSTNFIDNVLYCEEEAAKCQE